jgi:hypothetical protein
MEELIQRSSFLAWTCINDEVEDIKLGFVLKNRSFPNGEGEGG